VYVDGLNEASWVMAPLLRVSRQDAVTPLAGLLAFDELGSLKELFYLSLVSGRLVPGSVQRMEAGGWQPRLKDRPRL